MDEQLDVLPYSLITVCLYAPIIVPQVWAKGRGRSLLVGEWTNKFPRGGGDMLLPKKHTFQSCGSPIPIPGFVTGRLVGKCTTSAPQ